MARSSSEKRRGHWREGLRLWQRFPVRLMVWYGGASVLLVAALSMWSYTQQVDAEMNGLQQRLLSMAHSLALRIDGDAVFGLGDGPEAMAYWAGVSEDFQRLADTEPDVGEIYLMRVMDRPGHFEHLVDVVPVGVSIEVADWIEGYDATDLPKMLEGLERPTAEERPWADELIQDDGSLLVLWSISGYAPVHDSAGSTVALVGVDVFARRVQSIRRHALGQALAAFALALALLGAVTMVLGRQIVGPLGEVIDATTAVAEGDLQVRIRPSRLDEFGLLGRHFDEMADGLEDRDFLRDTFGRYVSPRVAESILAHRDQKLGGEVREVTVVFTDLRGYSTITEHAEPSEVVTLLNDYFGAMNEIIDAHDGVVIEFLGDGILAVFGAPVELEDHARHAVDAALAMRAELDRLNDAWEVSGRAALWQSAGIDRLVMRMGIHTGRVVAGNMGSRTRTKYAVIGDNVNVAARLEQYNKTLGTTILMSEAVKGRIGDAYATHPHGAAKVKGRNDPIDIFSL